MIVVAVVSLREFLAVEVEVVAEVEFCTGQKSDWNLAHTYTPKMLTDD